ncbi:HMG-box, partial [Dendrothele bispora CBS 962.96]
MPADRASLPPESSSKIPRPPNAWILFRSDMSRRVDPNIVDSTGRPTRKTQAAVSKEISEMWKNLDAQTRAEYERRADAKKAEHSIQYPNYRFAPVKKEDR